MDPVLAVDMQRLLDAVEDAPPSAAVQVMAEELGRSVGASEVAFLAVDLRGRQLARLTRGKTGDADVGGAIRGSNGDRSEEIPLPIGGRFEQVLRDQDVLVERTEDEWSVLVPVSERGETVGILEMRLPEQPEAGGIAYLRSIGHLLAFVVIANRRHTDLFEWGQRGAPLTLSAEIQRRLLPSSFTVEAGPLTVAGWLEPAVSVAGDTFDYSLDSEVLHLSVTDAMGHGVQSSLLATVMVGSSRNSRHRGLSLLESARDANKAVAEHGRVEGGFVTGLLLRLHLARGSVDIVNAGHVLPLLFRDDELRTVDLPVGMPFGVAEDTEYEVTSVDLVAGDRLLLVTDGMLERNAARLDLPAAVRSTGQLHPREAVRELADAVVDAAGGQLQDDATVLVLDWHGPEGVRDSRGGANRGGGGRRATR